METTDFKEFCDTFNVVSNAMSMRNLVRWNGCDLREKENLAEHTHLVVACVIDIAEMLRKNYLINISDNDEFQAMKLAMYHDSVEMLRGDILSTTKSIIPGVKEYTDNEEGEFMAMTFKTELTDTAKSLLYLSDLKACYKFLERELRYPSNDYGKKVYVDCLKKYNDALTEFLLKHNILPNEHELFGKRETFVKGYADDAGVDIVLDKDVTFLPQSTTVFELDVTITPSIGEMAFLCARTSAAVKGLSVAVCPIDPNYTGNCSAIVHNVSNQIIEYKAGESFCQYVMIKMIPQNVNYVKKQGKRSTSKFGGTDVC